MKKYLIVLWVLVSACSTSTNYIDYPNIMITSNYNLDFLDKTYVLKEGTNRNGFPESKHNFDFDEIGNYLGEKFVRYGMTKISDLNKADYVITLSYAEGESEQRSVTESYYSPAYGYDYNDIHHQNRHTYTSYQTVYPNFLDLYIYNKSDYLQLKDEDPELNALYVIRINNDKTYPISEKTTKCFIDKLLYNFPRQSGTSLVSQNEC